MKVATHFCVILILLLFSVESQAIKVAAFGDSITRGFPYYTDDANGFANNGGYIPGLQSKLNTSTWGEGSSVTVYNWGHPGEHVYGEGEERFPQILASNPDYVLILDGTNDLALGWHGPTDISNKLNALVNDVLVAGKIPIIGTIMPRFDGDVASNDIISINNNIRANAANSEVEVAELYYASANWNALMGDGLHTNLSGYSLMATVWFNALEEDKANKLAIEQAKIAGSISAVNYILLLAD